MYKTDSDIYEVIDNTPTVSVNQWLSAGLSYHQFRMDSQRGCLKIFSRKINGETRIDATSIRRPDRRLKIEQYMGKIEEAPVRSLYAVETDEEARAFFIGYRKPDGGPLTAERVTEYTHRASVFNALRDGMRKQISERARQGKRLVMGEFWKKRLEWHTKVAMTYNIPVYSNVRGLERAFKTYLNEGYLSIVHKNEGNDAARRVSDRTEKLLLALWIGKNKPFVNEVHAMYMDFIYEEDEFFDKNTGEIFKPEEFRYVPKGGGEPRPLEISVSTVWNYLKDHINDAATADKRDGNYIASVEKRPYEFRKSPDYSLSKISMDDADLSRKMKGDKRVHRYMAFDVASGYWFTPVYSRDALTKEDVAQCMRNMFCEIELLGLPIPGEIEHEHHLVDGEIADMLGHIVQFVTASSHSRNKRAEHAIKSLKWGVSHKNNHTRGRFFGKGSYRSVRFREKGEFKEKEYEYDMLVEDDLRDIEEHNNKQHPLQKKYPGMTRRDVFLKRFNQKLKRMDAYYLYRFIGNKTVTSIYNNNHLQVNYEKYLLDDYRMLERLQSGNTEVAAYWIPEEDGSVDKVYIYQGDTYIGSATNVEQFRYNESKFEATAEDDARRLAQDKRLAKFEKRMKDVRSEIPRLGIQDAKVSAAIAAVHVEIVEAAPVAAVDYCEYEYEYDAEALAMERL